MAYPDDYRRSEVPGGVPLIVPKTVVPAGQKIGIAIPFRPRWIKVHNTGTVALLQGYSGAGLDNGVGWEIGDGATDTDSAVEAVRSVWFEAPAGGADGEVTLKIAVGRDTFTTSHPELTVANGFPSFDDSDTDAIEPGVG